MDRELTLRIILERPPIGVDFGMQKGRGNNYATVQTQRSIGKDLHFECKVRVSRGKDSAPNFLGPFVQGPVGERFLYVDIGTYAGQTATCWSRRLKIPLKGITWNMLETASSEPATALETRVPGAGKDGSPACATVKSFEGWQVA